MKSAPPSHRPSTTCHTQDHIQFVVDAIENGWTVRKDGVFYELTNDTQTDVLQVPSMSTVSSVSALFEDMPRAQENIVSSKQ